MEALRLKTIRQKAILSIIEKQDVETQNQLLDALLEAGVKSTQATISRDIKEMRLVKELTPRGTYRYAEAAHGADHSDRLRKIFRESVISYDSAMNLVILKTLPGLAPAACSAVDGMSFQDLVGTIAGDDTAFLAMRDIEAAKRLCSEIATFFA